MLLRTSRDTLQEFRILVIELHDLNLWIRKELFNRYFLPAINNLLLDFVPIHFHANNAGGFTPIYGIKFPNTIELTLVNRSNGKLLDGNAILPHPLDSKNINESDLQMPFELIEELLLKLN